MYSIHVNFILWTIQQIILKTCNVPVRKKASLIDLMSSYVKIWSKTFRGTHLSFCYLQLSSSGEIWENELELNGFVGRLTWWNAISSPRALSLWQATSGHCCSDQLMRVLNLTLSVMLSDSCQLLGKPIWTGNCLCPNYAGSETGL